jgi:hypothetical protein
MREPEYVYRRRRAGAVVVLIALAVVVLAVVSALGGGGDPSPGQRAARSAATPAPPPVEPRGGRTLLPRYRIVGFYGAPGAPQLGTLGIGTPAQAVARLGRQAQPYARGGRPVMPMLELIAVVAAHDPGLGGRYSIRLAPSVIGRYLAAARRARALLVLDVQPGRSDFVTEVKRLRRWLKLPDVGLALDPEWRMDAGQIPGQVIGHVTAPEVNATTGWLSRLIVRYRLPQKLVIVHQFTDDMVDEAALDQQPGEAIVLNADGFGSRVVKIAKYKRFERQAPQFGQGFKLFYRQDLDVMPPRRVLRLHPVPDVIDYE